MQESTDWILGWSEALDCHEQSDPLKARGHIVEIAPITLSDHVKAPPSDH